MEAKPEQKSIEDPVNAGIDNGTSQEDKLFFNVMPKAASTGFVQPEIHLAGVQGPAKNERPAWRQIIGKYKKYFIIGALAAAAGIAVYFAANYLGRSSYKSDNLLNPNAVRRPPKQPVASSTPPAAIAASSTPSGTGFTTPPAWRDKYFGAGCSDPAQCGDGADPDHDGLTNLEEYQLGTDPNNADSGGDGIADGDKVHVFGIDPLKARNGVDQQYSDADYIKGGYDFTTDKKLTDAQISALRAKMQEFGLHEPTISTVGAALNTVYGFTPAAAGAASSTPTSAASSTVLGASIVAGVDESAAAKQQRDAARSNTITKIEIALVKYDGDNGHYPPEQDFDSMVSDIKPYLTIATNTADPLNNPPEVYSYTANQAASDFDLSFYSETLGQIITKNAAAAQADAAKEQADIYDNQRMSDLESLRLDLLLYSNDNVAGNQTYVFPTAAKFKTSLVPKYANQIPVDPKTGKDYDYEVSGNFTTFTLKTLLDDPPTGTTGYVCNQDSCQNY